MKLSTYSYINMAKAALNMMSVTLGKDFVEDGIYMNLIDIGWINDENLLEKVVRLVKEKGF